MSGCQLIGMRDGIPADATGRPLLRARFTSTSASINLRILRKLGFVSGLPQLSVIPSAATFSLRGPQSTRLRFASASTAGYFSRSQWKSGVRTGSCCERLTAVLRFGNLLGITAECGVVAQTETVWPRPDRGSAEVRPWCDHGTAEVGCAVIYHCTRSADGSFSDVPLTASLTGSACRLRHVSSC